MCECVETQSLELRSAIFLFLCCCFHPLSPPPKDIKIWIDISNMKIDAT